MKKLIPIITLLLAVSMSAFAQEDTFEINGVEYHITSNNTVEVTGSAWFGGSELIIPEKVTCSGKEYTVTGISDGVFPNNENITYVRIPATVKTIGNEAFDYCKNLTSCTFEGQSKLKEIGNYAFLATGLTTIDIPANVETIGYFSFAYNPALQQVYMHSNNPSGYSSNAFDDCGDAVIYVPVESYETYKNQFPNNKVEVPLDIFKPYALNTIEDGLNALNTLSDEDREDVNNYLSDITDPSTFDDAYNAFKNAMSIINDQINFEKNLKTALGSMATKQNGPAVEIVGADGTTIRLYNIEKVRYIKVNEE